MYGKKTLLSIGGYTAAGNPQPHVEVMTTDEDGARIENYNLRTWYTAGSLSIGKITIAS